MAIAQPVVSDLAIARAYAAQRAAIRTALLQAVETSYSQIVDPANIVASMGQLADELTILIAEGQLRVSTLTGAYLRELALRQVGRLIEPVIPVEEVGTNVQGKPLQEGMAAHGPMVLAQLLGGQAVDAALAFGKALFSRFADNEVTRMADRTVETQPAHAKPQFWRGIVSPSACDRCQARNSGVHPIGQKLYRHGNCNCDRTLNYTGPFTAPFPPGLHPGMRVIPPAEAAALQAKVEAEGKANLKRWGDFKGQLAALGVDASGFIGVDEALWPNVVAGFKNLHRNFPWAFELANIQLQTEGGPGLDGIASTRVLPTGFPDVPRQDVANVRFWVNPSDWADGNSLREELGRMVAKGWLVTETPEQVIYHEFGHILDGIAGDGQSYYSELPRWRIDSSVSKPPSGYGATNRQGDTEGFAETFAKWMITHEPGRVVYKPPFGSTATERLMRKVLAALKKNIAPPDPYAALTEADH